MKVAKNKTPGHKPLSTISGDYKNTQLDKIILDKLESECFGYGTIAVYGGAYHLARRYDNPSLQDIATGAIRAINDAKFYTPEVPATTVTQRFCSLFYVDYMLIEAFIGIRFS